MLPMVVPSFETSKNNCRYPPDGICVDADIKRTLVAVSERTGMSVSQVTDEVLYTGLIEMQELPELDD